MGKRSKLYKSTTFSSILCKDSKYTNFPNHRKERLGKRKDDNDKGGKNPKDVAFALLPCFFEKWKLTIGMTNKQARKTRQDRCKNYRAQIKVKIIQML